MKVRVSYDDAVDLLDSDHKAVHKMFIEYGVMCEDDAPVTAKHALAKRICDALTVHAQIEEEIFYPEVRNAIADEVLMDRALDEHAAAKELIATMEAMPFTDAGYDAVVKQLGAVIEQHVLEEREQIFLAARLAALDLRGMVLPLLQRQRELTEGGAAVRPKEAA